MSVVIRVQQAICLLRVIWVEHAAMNWMDSQVHKYTVHAALALIGTIRQDWELSARVHHRIEFLWTLPLLPYSTGLLCTSKMAVVTISFERNLIVRTKSYRSNEIIISFERNIRHSNEIFIIRTKSSSFEWNLRRSNEIFVVRTKSSSFERNLIVQTK